MPVHCALQSGSRSGIGGAAALFLAPGPASCARGVTWLAGLSRTGEEMILERPKEIKAGLDGEWVFLRGPLST